MTWHEALPYVIFAVTFLASILSGMAGGGGGFIITPFLIAIGLTPQQSIATGKVGAPGLDIGAIFAFRGRRSSNKRLIIIMMVTAGIIGAISSQVIRRIGNHNLQLIMGSLNLVMIPLLFIKHNELSSRRRHEIFQAAGFICIVAIMLLQGIFSSGIGSLINVCLILFFGLTPLRANLVKRKASLVADVVILVGLLGSRLINYEYGLITAAGGLAGGYIGSKFAIREGEKFARYALMVFMLVSGVWLIASA